MQPSAPSGFRSQAPKNIEDQVRAAYFTPCPQAYDPRPVAGQVADKKVGGKISNAQVPSALGHPAKTHGYVPGPGSYQTHDPLGYALPDGGRLNRKPPDDKYKLDEYPRPAPHDYGRPKNPAWPRAVSGQFSKTAKRNELIHQEQRRAKGLPGPGAHEVQESMESVRPFCPEGGRTLVGSKPTGYFDTAPTLSHGLPGPGTYDLAGDIKPQELGRLVYKYESATIQESNHLVTRAVGARNEAPGPGAYNIPEPAPLAPAPAMRGRNVKPLPAPFADRLNPDLARKFIVPVREQNSGEQIYGTGLSRSMAALPSASKDGGSPGRPASVGGRADQVPAIELPQGVGEPLMSDHDQIVDGVQWKSGGFASLKKSRSTGNVRSIPDMHPNVEQASKFYISMARKNGRGDNIFLPGSSRRSENILTHENCEAFQRLARGKYQLKAVAEGIQSATAAALEPLDTEKLRSQAMIRLRDKARERMRLEGVSEDQQDLVLQEMHGVLEEASGKAQLMQQAQASQEQV
jgi:hypothetical protein